MNKLPKAKNEHTVVQALGDEILIYNVRTNRAHCLNETAGKVFEACDGETTFEDLKRRFQFTDELIDLALDNLQKEDLLAADYVSPLAKMSRRKVIRKIGLTTLIALPTVFSLVAPTASRAASGLVAACQPCANSAQCASGNCAPVYQGSGNICSDGFRTDLTFRPNTGLITVGEIVCPSFGAGYCCSSSSRFTAPGTCTCNG
jgi:hypothetical protein